MANLVFLLHHSKWIEFETNEISLSWAVVRHKRELCDQDSVANKTRHWSEFGGGSR